MGTNAEAEFHKIYSPCQDRAAEFAVKCDIPRVVGTQRHQANYPCSSAEEYYKRATFIPYRDDLKAPNGVSHNLKKIAKRADIKVVFSAPDKLAGLCKGSNPHRQPPLQCAKNHETKCVKCVENVANEIPLSCGKQYIRQTGRCMNERLREHSANVRNGHGEWLVHHCSKCGCDADFYKCVVIGKNKEKTSHEIIEAETIDHLKANCVSTPSVSLSQK